MIDARKEKATKDALESIFADYPSVKDLEEVFERNNLVWNTFLVLVDIIDARRKLHSVVGYDADDDAAIYFAYNTFTDAALELSSSIERSFRELKGYNLSFTLDTARKCASRR